MLSILTTIIETSYQTIPLNNPKRKGNKFKLKKGWNTRVAPLRKDAIKWHKVWTQEGKPKEGWLKDTMVKTRKAYHQEIKIIKKEEDKLRAQKLPEASLNGDRPKHY